MKPASGNAPAGAAKDTVGAERTPWRPKILLAVLLAAVLGLVAGMLLQQDGLLRAQEDAALANKALIGARAEAMLSAAVIEAQSGRYEMARQRASDFYTGLQRQLLPSLGQEQQAAARRMLSERDSVITALARNDPAAAGDLASILTRLRELTQELKPDSSAVGTAPRE